MRGVAGIEAFGKPGIEPRWTHSNKAGIGTAYSASSHLWFTIWNGIVTEVYYPTIDRPQLRDLQFLITDGKTFFHEEKRDLTVLMERISDHALGYRCTNADPDGRYTITKEIIGDPHLASFSCAHKSRAKTVPFSPASGYLLFAPRISKSAARATMATSASPTAGES